jgi:hypothetical protein
MQTLSRTTFSIAVLFVAMACQAAEEHLMIDRTGESIVHYAENTPPSSALATNLPIPWSVAWDANSNAVYWTEIGSGSIYRKFMDDGTIEQVYHSSNAVLRGLVLNSATDTLYFMDSDMGTLNALDLVTFTNNPFLYGFRRPNDMVLDRVNNALFICAEVHIVRGSVSSRPPVKGYIRMDVRRSILRVRLSCPTGYIEEADLAQAVLLQDTHPVVPGRKSDKLGHYAFHVNRRIGCISRIAGGLVKSDVIQCCPSFPVL